MICPNCSSTMENDAVFCGNCGQQVAPIQAQGATIAAEATEQLRAGNNIQNNKMGAGGNYPQFPFPTPATPQRGYSPQPGSYSPPPGSYPPADQIPTQFAARTPAPPPPTYRPPRSGMRTAFVVTAIALVIILVSLGTFALIRNRASNTGTNTATGNTAKTGTTNNAGVAAGASGIAAFSDSTNGQGHSDTVKISINGLQAPPAGSQYNAWLLDEANEKTLGLGILTQQGQTYSVAFTGKNIDLLGAGNKIEITQEQGNVTQPIGTVIVSGTFPPQAFVHIRHLLFSFGTTPNHIGLLVGLRDQAQKLNAQALLLKTFAESGNTLATSCTTQSIIDIAEGSHGSHYRPLDAACASVNVTQAGDGFGLLPNTNDDGYIATAAAHASLAATRSDSTQNIKTHAGHVEIATTNLKGWVGTIDQDARALLRNSNDNAKIQEIVTLASNAYNGVDIDNDEHVDPVPGEAGAITAYIHGQLMAQLPLGSGK
jgi:hypothetical protein